MNGKKINKKIKSIWKEFRGEKFTERKPLLFKDLKKNPDILFVGINPGYSEELSALNEKELIRHDRNIQAEKKEEAYPYFRPFYDFTNNWEHIDLLFIRETNQNKVKKMVCCGKKIELNEFGIKQLDLFSDLLKIIKPKIIIINNALASTIIKKEFNKNLYSEDFKEKGFDYFYLGKLKIPIFFTGMLSGQRALDRGSKRRLIWQANKALGRNRKC